ncbi:MAG: hypothetical protein P1V34_02670 [Alphaproteobacteria bacterium]|nr:hypothetical protein [Alphaproteobacteria bacterium]
MDRGMIYFGLVALGAVLLVLAFRHRGSGARLGMLSTLITCAIAVALTYMILFKLMD